MPLTPDAQKLALERARSSRAALKARYRERLGRLMEAVSPPLTTAELALGLGLEVSPTGASPVSRWLSEAQRLARSTPDHNTHALINALLDGELHLAVDRTWLPGKRRQVLVCHDKDLPWLASHLAVVNLAGRELGEVGSANTDWDDTALWDPFAEPEAPVLRVCAGTPRPLLGTDVFPLVLGTLRLCTAGRPERAEALALLRAAHEAGVSVFDTADTYGLDDPDRGYGERLCREAVPDALVETKVGLSRPQGRWVPAGRPEQLVAAAEASARRMGELPLLLLHAPEPSVPFTEQLGALAGLRERGVVGQLGLCNVSGDQLDAAREVFEVACVQVAASWFSQRALDDLGERCVAAGIPLMAHSPLGGHARRGRPRQEAELQGIASQLGVSPEQVALAWLLSLSDAVLPVVGTTRAASLADSLAAMALELSPSQLERLDRGPRRAVLDNTYPTRKSRRGVIEAAAEAGVPAEAVLLDVPRADALVNAAGRILDKLGALPEPGELSRLGRTDPNLLPPSAIYRWFERFEPPTTVEGFARVEVVPFVRRHPAEQKGRAVFLDLDGTVRGTHSGAPFPHDADDVRILDGRAEALEALSDAGWTLVGVTNQAGIARGQLTREAAERAVARTVDLLGVPLDVLLCPHGSEQGCWCRKPMPGLGVLHLRTHGLDPRRSHMVGDMDSDRGFAENLGLVFHDAEAFFGGTWQALLEG